MRHRHPRDRTGSAARLSDCGRRRGNLGPRLIIDSVGDGKRIALGIDRYLTGRERPEPEIEVEVFDHHHMASDFMNISRQPVPMLPLDRRTGVTEVEIGYDEASAMREARRCLRCY